MSSVPSTTPVGDRPSSVTPLNGVASPPPDAGPPLRMPIDVRSVALSVLAVAASIVLLRYMQDVLIPLALGTLLFYALDRPVDWLERLRVPRAVGAALALAVFVAGLGSLGYTLQGQAADVIDRLPAGARKLRETIRGPSPVAPTTLAKVDEAAKELQKEEPPAAPDVVRVQIEDSPFQIGDYLWSGSMNAVSFVNQMIMILFLTYFMLLSNDLFKRKVVELAGPTLTTKKVTVQILDEIAEQIERFLMIQLLTSTLVALATGVALWLLGLEGAAFWGLLAGVFNSVPYYGPLLVTGGLSVVAFVQFETLGMTVAVAGVALLVTSAEGFLLTPILVSGAAQMNRVSVFASLLFWTWMWGVWGLLLAVPLTMVVKAVCDRVEDLQPIGRFLGD